MTFQSNYDWNGFFSHVASSNAVMHDNGEPFRAFSFHGPDPDELLVSMKTPTEREWTVLSKHETFMQECDWQQWNDDSFNFIGT